MNFQEKQQFLKKCEKDFLWALAMNDQKEAVRYFGANYEFENIIRYSINNRIENHLFKFLKDNGLLGAIGNKTIYTIENSIEKRAKRSLVIYQKALSILNEFTLKKVRYVALKGIAYLEYNNAFDRPIRDIDVLIHPNDIKRAVDIAFKYGFKFKEHSKFSKNMIISNSDIYDLPDLVDENNVCMEIHYKILRDSNSAICKLSEALFMDEKIFCIHRSNIKTSSLSSCISHLLYHASKKGNFDIGLGSIFDLRALTKNISEENQTEIRNISHECGFSRESELFLSIIKDKSRTSGDRNAFLLRELILSPNVNIKIQEFFLKASFLDKMKYVFTLLFVGKRFIKREFQSETPFFLGGYFGRWARQLKQFWSYLSILVFKQELFKRRAKLIKEFYKD